ncbi:hypothetical protein BDV28DRAFT_159988 [Aspergillus coremiiformis]|uniref:F-box domain-containing protein n=1 Tax=Aspergillus coremiiformis TaxID=138285 RepID=A0A5N6YXX8_9EURO|nr:hypothetical protein BDV28DRAFT_159988 [Aspergillus coremiiformis]
MDRLPNELLLSIGEYLDRPTRRALTGCCRQFHQLFEPLLYSTFTFSIRKPSHSIALGRHLWRRPDLARHCRHAKFNFICCCHSHSYANILDHALIEQMVNRICETHSEKAHWKEHLHSSCHDAWSAVLLTCLSHLRSLVFNGCDAVNFIPRILDKAALRQRPFHENVPFSFLQEVGLPSSLLIHYNFSAALFHFPAVRKIVAEGISDVAIENKRARRSALVGIRNPVCSITEIVVLSVRIPYSMSNWIAACNRLECFKVCTDMGLFGFDANTFRQCLLPSKDTLKSVTVVSFTFIDFRPGQPRNPIPGGIPFGSFKEFHTLERLTIPHSRLTRVHINGGNEPRQSLQDMLPSSLRFLGVIEDVGVSFVDLVPDLHTLVNVGTDLMPNLERIELMSLQKPEESVQRLVDALAMACETKGICLIYRPSLARMRDIFFA